LSFEFYKILTFLELFKNLKIEKCCCAARKGEIRKGTNKNIFISKNYPRKNSD